MRTIIHLCKEKETRKKLGFTILVIAIVRLLANVPVLGVNPSYLSFVFERTNAMNFLDMLSGGSLSQLSIAAFGISSYVTASIFMQLLSVFCPRLEKMRRDGQVGQKRFERMQFCLAISITIASSIGILLMYGASGLLMQYHVFYAGIAIVSWIMGSVVVLALSLQVEEHGIGNGISLLLTFNILSRIPQDFLQYYEEVVANQTILTGIGYLVGGIIFLYICYILAAYLQSGRIKVPIRATRKKTSVLNEEAYLPMGVNIANVLPVIYATSLIAFPQMIGNLFSISVSGTLEKFLEGLDSSNWYPFSDCYAIGGFSLYLLLLMIFGLFSSQMNFCSEEIADNMKKRGDILIGVAPGELTIRYLEKRRKALAIINILFLIVLTIVPDMVCSFLNIHPFQFVGTSLIIIMNTLWDVKMRCQALTVHHKKDFLIFPERKRRKYASY